MGDTQFFPKHLGIYGLIFGGKRNDLPFKFLQSVLKKTTKSGSATAINCIDLKYVKKKLPICNVYLTSNDIIIKAD